ncbi:26S proteasome regulatory subunit RPN1 [Mycena indigotica]|uniref:26S proteasome regulatory subunit RPN1 n=1 Tax=Mycena indigotica TaxID=2126181 RepID=A0A8H6S7S0_9AGAR|nr:26S proteasome regulatory subunit RPN1 [Mycena indigotica]KAF7293666.1 26S proteasome regulatory subunit RPN1 [Mycena indigotica]
MPSDRIEVVILQVVTRRDFATNRTPKKTDKQTGLPNLSKEKRKDGEKRGDELCVEDQQFSLEGLAGRLNESNADVYKPALETLRILIRTSTSLMASVPKPPKFLHLLYPDLRTLYETWEPSGNKSLFAAILLVFAMTYSDTPLQGTPRYRLLAAEVRPAGSPLSDPGSWDEYVRHLAAELGDEYNIREQEDDEVEPVKGSSLVLKVPDIIDDLRSLQVAKECVVFLLDHNAEPDAIDLLQELEMVEESIALVDRNTYTRVCQYLVGQDSKITGMILQVLMEKAEQNDKSLPIGLNNVSNPQRPILNSLSKYSHDTIFAIALNAILATGLVGTGINNARLAQMLRQLAGYYYKEPECLFTVRIAQGLVHVGQGTIGLDLFYSDRSIMSRPAVTSLLAVRCIRGS